MIYLASPYSHPDSNVRHERYVLTLAYTNICMRHGEIIFSPIVYGHQFADLGLMDTDYKSWQSLNDTMILKCDSFRVLMLEGWQESRGVTHEIAFAEAHNKPISYIKPQGFTG